MLPTSEPDGGEPVRLGRTLKDAVRVLVWAGWNPMDIFGQLQTAGVTYNMAHRWHGEFVKARLAELAKRQPRHVTFLCRRCWRPFSLDQERAEHERECRKVQR